MKILLYLTLTLFFTINSDFVDDDYTSIMNCIYTDIDKCSSTRMKTKDLECCLFDLKNLESTNDDEDSDDSGKICSAVFTSYVSNSMMSQIEAIATEDYGILKAYLNIDIPRIREDIKCATASASYEFGGYKYTSDDLVKLKSKNHCLYYYYNSIGRNMFNDKVISIEKEKCVNAESLDVTKNADIYCAYADVAILYSDGTKSEFKTCYFLPSESIKSKKLDPTTEAALRGASQTQASNSGKQVQEYEAKMVDKTGRTITYNSVSGVTSSSDAGNIKISKILYMMTLGLMLLL